MKVPSFLNKPVAFIFDQVSQRQTDAQGRPLIDALERQMIAPVQMWPPVMTQALVVDGLGELNRIAARRAAEAVHGGALEDRGVIYFTGGVRPVEKDRKNGLGLLARQKAAGLSVPAEDDVEAPDAARTFREHLIKLGGDPDNYIIRIGDTSTNTKENIEAAKALGAGAHMLVGLVGLPFSLPRMAGAWRTVMGGDAVLRLMPVWPEEIGLRPHSWKNDYIARSCFMAEANKYMLPTPETAPYVKSKYVNTFSMSQEMDEALAIFEFQDPKAAAEWKERQFNERSRPKAKIKLDDEAELRQFLQKVPGREDPGVKSRP